MRTPGELDLQYMKTAAHKKDRRACFFPSGGPSAPGRRFVSDGSCGGRAAQARRGAPVRLRRKLLASTPYIAAAPLIMLLAYGQAGALLSFLYYYGMHAH